MASLLIIGGTGYAGSHIVSEAVSRGHEVTLVSRNEPAEKLEGVTYRTGDLTQQVPDLAGADVVIAALSPRGSNEGALRAAYGSLAKAAAVAGVRFVAIGGFSSLRPAEGAPRFTEAGEVPAEFAAEAHEMNAILGDLLASDEAGEWVFVSPAAEFGAHVPGEKLGHYRTSHEVAIFDADGTSAISGADFAAAVVDEIDTPTLKQGQISFAY
ncbi:NAD-dependent epimerase [Microbacterium nanhaiense]|uniref:NAD-dependent epimerase n=1 Tax=Microbacterium nanhaiense TaxID=1301026 RepID=A0ABQ2N5H5_9MICO|nr:NAD(P)H-binding protein [Microbacterium nanhaiense]GGO67266.1 NAD-dependent epimerase [Microbacterium nanhaiense]